MTFALRAWSDVRAGRSTWRIVLTLDFIALAMTVVWACL